MTKLEEIKQLSLHAAEQGIDPWDMDNRVTRLSLAMVKLTEVVVRLIKDNQA